MALWPSVSISATSMLHPRRVSAEPISWSNPGWSCVTISSSVLCADDASSKLIRVSTVTFGARPRVALSRLFRSGSRGAFPFTTSARLLRKRSASLGFSSSVRCKSEVESIQHDAGGIRESIRLVNVHAPTGQHARNRREESRAVRRKQRQGESMARGEEFGLHRISAQLPVQRKVRGNLRRRMHREIPPRESFEEPFNLFDAGV